MLEIKELRFGYGSQQVLKGVNLQAETGDLIFLLGGNGAGKTTLFKCVLGLLHGYTGDVSIAGKSTRSMMAREQAGKIAFIPQSHSNVFQFSVLDMVLMGTNHQLGPFASPGKAERKCAMEALEQVGIASFAKRNYHELSGGEQPLVLVARALAHQAKILLMDEPTASLDYGNQLKVLDKVTALANQGYTILLSCHNPQQSLLYAARIIVLHNGVIAADGRPDAVLNEALLQKIYGVATRFVYTDHGILIAPERESKLHLAAAGDGCLLKPDSNSDSAETL
ncbi:MAG: ABC transporter ATP-binding protein [Oscillospiraceae bacterium]|nr:ABC transporter ATP-binding protein [Oscillospiraceae bacterium]